MNRKRTKNADPRELSEDFRGPPKKINVGNKTYSIEYRVAYFPQYIGRPPRARWNKPVVGPPDRPFAELQLVSRLERDGWTAAWVHRPGMFIRTWEPKTYVEFPVSALKLLERIRKKAGTSAGSWDVFAWKAGKPLFIEVKRLNSTDKLRASQLTWRTAALAMGVPESAFQLVEWCGGSLKGRTIRLTSYFGVDVKGWAECRDGAIAYSDPSKGVVRGMVDFYQDSGARTNADLMWLMFVRNSSGMTWCDFDEFPSKKKPASRT